MENLLFRLEQLYNSRTKKEKDLIFRLRYNNLKYAAIDEVLESLDELRIRISEIETNITIEKIKALRVKLCILEPDSNY